ncbi:MAG: archease [Gammaproteobacteria bacterium]|jgi:tRNA nucleotidyltransferase (CCA-adding enzyme)
MSIAHWEHFEHKADIGIRGIGSSLAEAFEQTALALTAVVTDINLIRANTTLNICCNDASNDTLLYDWLNTLIYEMATRKMLFSQFKVKIDQGQLSATVAGEAIDIPRHQPAAEIKGATFTELAVYQDQDQWFAQCVVDV